MIWRVIPFETCDPNMNLALDEVLLNSVGNLEVSPTIRFYGWKENACIIGCFQKMLKEINISKCKQDGVLFTRRISGGGAVYQDKIGGLTYTLAVHPSYFNDNIHTAYKETGKLLINALNSMGMSGSFVPINDILVKNKKISGNALVYTKNSMLVHGTLLHSLSLEKMFSYLNITEAKISDKLIKSVSERVTCIQDHVNITKGRAIKLMQSNFIKDKSITISSWTDKELESAEQLVKTKFSKDNWLFKR